MFTSIKKAIGIKTELDPIPVVVPTLPEDQREFEMQYNQLASKLGLRTMQVAGISLATILHEEGIPQISRAAVEKYMDSKGYWYWYPVHKRDDGFAFNIARITPHGHASIFGGMKNSDVYADAIPYPVLITMEKIVNRLGVSVAFYVAALGTHPDPFLAVIHRHTNEVFVVERWDEPSFRG